MKNIILILLSFSILFSSEVYFMPKDGKKAEQKLYSLYSHAKKEIKITIYTFTNKKLARALKIAAKKGVQIYIIADKEEAKYKRSVIPNLAALKNFHVYLLSGKEYKDGKSAKMHVKLSIIDNNYLITGSANYSYSAFYKNYEYLIINKDRYLINEFKAFFNHLRIMATNYRLSR